MSSPKSAGWSDLFSAQHIGPLFTLCLGVALLSFNSFLVATAIPTAVADIGGISLISWATTLFLVFAIVGGASGSILKTRFGARKAMIVSAIVFIIGSIIASIAGSMPELLVGRVLQGLGEGVVAAICYTLIPDLFPSSLVPKVFGAEAVVWALAAVGGPIMGGLLTEFISWRAAFWVNVPFAVAFIVLVLTVIPKQIRVHSTERVPLVRLSLIGIAIMIVCVGGILENIALTGLCLVLAAALLFYAVFADTKAKHKLFPSNSFRFTNPVGAGLWAVLLMPVAQSGANVFLVYILQNIWGYAPTVAGILGAIMAIMWSVFAIVVAGFRSPNAYIYAIRSGPALMLLGMAMLAAALMFTSLPLLLVGQLVLGAGMGCAWGYISQTIMEHASSHERDKASGLLPTVQSAGYAIGAAIAGLTANMAGFATAHTPSAVASAIMPVFLVSVAICAFAQFAVMKMTKNLVKPV